SEVGSAHRSEDGSCSRLGVGVWPLHFVDCPIEPPMPQIETGIETSTFPPYGRGLGCISRVLFFNNHDDGPSAYRLGNGSCSRCSTSVKGPKLSRLGGTIGINSRNRGDYCSHCGRPISVGRDNRHCSGNQGPHQEPLEVNIFVFEVAVSGQMSLMLARHF